MKKLEAGAIEGRRFLTALPHPFCGIGHGFAEWHTAYQWAQMLGLEFVHIPLKGEWDHFFGLGGLPSYEQVLKEYKPTIVRVPYAQGWSEGLDVFPDIKEFIDSIRSDKDLLFVLSDGQNSFDHISGARPFRNLFEENGDWQSLAQHHRRGKLNVAVHLRRGDVAQMAEAKVGNWQQRYVAEEWFVTMMDAVVEAAGQAQPCFHIYSQGEQDDFPLVRERSDICFHLDSCEEETLFNMARADILIMSPSGFSYLASMLSSGLRIAPYPWWHNIPGDENWIRIIHGEAPPISPLRNWILNRCQA